MIHIPIDRESPVSLARQMASFLRGAILSGTLAPGEKLPSTRALSRELRVARNVAVECMEQLAAEGYVETRRGSGAYVAEGVRFEPAAARAEPEAVGASGRNRDIVSFRTGVPDLPSIPVARWGKLYREIAQTVLPEKLNYQRPFGEEALQRELSKYLLRVRGVRAEPGDILITNGAAQAFSLISRFVPEGRYALAENPISYGILHTLRGNGVNIQTVPVDDNGMMTERLPQDAPGLIFTTPSHQFPTGVILPIRRRIEMIRYARAADAYIVEDDYDSEFRFDGAPVQSMQSLAPERVIYVGTFSKTLMPALRIGYVALPHALKARMEALKYVADLHSPILEQLTLARFIADGLFDRHILRMRKLYLERRNHLIACLKDAFGEGVAVSGAGAGMHLVASFRDFRFDAALMQKIEDAGVEIAPVSRHFLNEEGADKTPFEHQLIFGYGNTPPEAIAEGVRRLRAAIPS